MSRRFVLDVCSAFRRNGTDALCPAISLGHELVLILGGARREVSLLQPMLYLKNATQQGLPFTLNPAVLYRGLAMSVVSARGALGFRELS